MPLRRLNAAGLALLLLPSCSPSTEGPARVPPAAGTSRAASAPTVPSTARTPTPGASSAPRPAATATAAPTTTGAGETGGTTAPGSPDALVEQAEKAARGGDLMGAIGLLERALAVEPDHRKALFLLAIRTQERAYELERPMSSPFYLKSAQAIRKLREAYEDLGAEEREALGPVLYNEACTYAVQDQPDKALDALADAIDAGFFQPEEIAQDDELESIRKSPRFADLVRKAEQNARRRAGENARKLVAETPAFPFRFELPDLDGKKVTLDDVKANVLIVDIWGTWCPPCRKEIPHFKELLARYRDQGLAIVGINYERVADEDVKATIQAFVKEDEVPYTCLIGDDKTRDQIPDFVGYPTTLFLDGSGKVRAKTVGYQSLVDLEAIVTLLLEQGGDIQK